MGRQAILLALALSAVGAPALAASVTGSVTYRERMALPPGYVLRVELRDISRQDAASEEIASVEMRPRRQVPIRYALRYDPGRIDPAYMYSVSARILIDGRLAFISTRINSVLTRGASSKADILLQPVGRPPQ
jgi:putative lipoprotein